MSRSSRNNTPEYVYGMPSDVPDDVDEILPSMPDEVTPAPVTTVPDGLIPATTMPPVVEQMSSVLQVGSSPWMRSTTTTPGASAAILDPPFDHTAQLVSVGRTASLFHEIQSLHDKENRTAQRKRAVEKKQEDENKLEEWEVENLHRCKWYFILGCFGLPLLHFVSVFCFFNELKGHDRDFKIKKYIYLSLLVGIIETFIWILWIVVFQLLRETSLKNVNILNFNYTVGSLV